MFSSMVPLYLLQREGQVIQQMGVTFKLIIEHF